MSFFGVNIVFLKHARKGIVEKNVQGFKHLVGEMIRLMGNYYSNVGWSFVSRECST